MSIHTPAYRVDLTNCDREPIHIIGTSQAHGVILVCDKQSFEITGCSENSSTILGFEAVDLLGKPLSFILPESSYQGLKAGQDEKIQLPDLTLSTQTYIVIAHSSNESWVFDIEPRGESMNPLAFQDQLSKILNDLNAAQTSPEMFEKTTSILKSLLGYDRVMMYRFDENWNGEVVAEEKQDDLNSWLGLYYPATDIPKPSRDLFLKQEVRMISDVNYIPAKIIHRDGTLNDPIDLTRSELRGVSPIHIQYLKNMKVGASLTAAIILKGRLWGLLACHHNTSKFVNYYQRQSVKFLTSIFSNKLAANTSNIYIEKTKRSTKVKNRLVDNMKAQNDILIALTEKNFPFTNLIECSGGAVFIEDNLKIVGTAPSKNDILELIEDVCCKQPDVFYTRHLEEIHLPAKKYKENASGLLSIRLGEGRKDYVIWFRQETIQTVNWGGKPEKEGEVKNGILHLTPRNSFEKWSQEVSGKSLPWQDYEWEAAAALKESITHLIIQHQKEKIQSLNERLRQVNEELKAFGYSISHDLGAPLRGINGFARILLESNSHNLDEKGLKSLNTIINSAEEMKGLIEDLLSYASMANEPLIKKPVNIKLLVEDIIVSFNTEAEYNNIKVAIDKDLPEASGDRRLLYQLFSNLISNAFKYTSAKTNARVSIGYNITSIGEVVYFVKDNGIGFDPKLKKKVFEVFSRLVGKEYSGSGIGLAIAKKVVNKHQGKIWVETEVNKGSVFYFTLTKESENNTVLK